MANPTSFTSSEPLITTLRGDITDYFDELPSNFLNDCDVALYRKLSEQRDRFCACVKGTEKDSRSLEKLLDADSPLSQPVEAKLRKLLSSTEKLFDGSLRMQTAEQAQRKLRALHEWAKKGLRLPEEVPGDALERLRQLGYIVETVMPQTILHTVNHNAFLEIFRQSKERAKTGSTDCISDGNDLWSVKERLDQLEWIVLWVLREKGPILNEKTVDSALKLLDDLRAWDRPLRKKERWALKLNERKSETLKQLEDTVKALMQTLIFPRKQSNSALKQVGMLCAWVQALQQAAKPQMDDQAVLAAFKELEYFMELLMRKTLLPKERDFPDVMKRSDADRLAETIENDLVDVESVVASLRLWKEKCAGESG